MAYITSVERIAAEEGKLEVALKMIKEFGLSDKEVADNLSIPLNELKERLNQDNQAK
ncbi:hypothetical protein [Hydrogenovibrio halophilus]|uniref:hypothetical protein n=1 Tax=Hydrogenovibrio halophilus TaxID=373391 RepID=UPI0003621846|nr:hypothetical protein [Hydrogenovibrio halophilus]